MESTADVLLEMSSVEAGYGPIRVLHGVSLVVRRGEIVTLIGANGAGKTTTLACLSGLLPPTGGDIRFAGRSLVRRAAHRIVADGLAHVPEGRRIFPRLSIQENLLLGAYTCRDQRQIREDMDRAFALFPILKERRRQAGGTLSGGEQQMLAIARGLMSRPSLLLMDEPSMGVAPLLVARIFDTIKTLNRDGLSILLVEQNARLALSCAHRGYVLETGSIVLEGTGADLLHHKTVQSAYLGDS